MIERTGCFAISDLPTFDLAPTANGGQWAGAVQVPLAYHLGVRLGLWLAYPIILTHIYWLRWSLYDFPCRLLSPRLN
jgi:hypothetical protein